MHPTVRLLIYNGGEAFRAEPSRYTWAPQTNRLWTPGAIGNRVPLSAKARDDEESTIITLAAVSLKIHQIAESWQMM